MSFRQLLSSATTIFKKPTLTITQNQFRAGLALKTSLVLGAIYFKQQKELEDESKILDATRKLQLENQELKEKNHTLQTDYQEQKILINQLTEQNYKLTLSISELKKESKECYF